MTAVLVKPSQIGSAEPEATKDRDKVERDRYGRPKIWVPEKKATRCYTRTTRYVDVLSDKSTLDKWGKRMVLVGATKAPPVVEKAKQYDPTVPADKQKLNGLAEELVEIAGANIKREKGTHLHGLSEHVDRGEQLPPCTPQDAADMVAYRMATIPFDITHIEQLVVHDELKVAGTPDRIAFYDGCTPDGCPAGNLILDLKTGSIEYDPLKMAMQLALYSRSVLYSHATRERYPLLGVNQNWGVIIHLPAGSGTATLYWIDLATGWEAVEVAASVRAMRRRQDVLTPFSGSESRVTQFEVDGEMVEVLG